MRRTPVTNISAGLLIFLFVYACLTKLADYTSFKNVLAQSPLISPFAATIAWALPFTELVTALLLFIPATQRTGLYASLGMLSLFTVYLLYMIRFSPALPCSCGGVLKQMTWRQHILFNIGYILVALTGILFKSKEAGSPKKVDIPPISTS